MKPVDLALLRQPGPPTVSPDGQFAVVALTAADLKANDYSSQLWRVGLSEPTPQPVQLTFGWRDSAPRISPDGKWLAFLRANREQTGSRAGGHKGEFEARPQLCVMPLSGGEPRRLTDHPLGAGPPAWAPDSARLAYAARVASPGRYGTGKDGFGEKLEAEAEAPRRINRLSYRTDDVGFTFDRPRHLFVVTLDGEIGAATTGPHDHEDPTWSPDGEWLTFAAARHDSYANDVANDIWVIRPDGSDLRALTDTTLLVHQPFFTPDGSAIVFVGASAGADRLSPTARSQVLWTVPFTGGPARALLDTEAYHLNAEISVVADGVLFPNTHRGSVQLVRVPFDGSQPELLIDGEREVMSAAGAAGVVVSTVSDPQTWGELYVGTRRLTDWTGPYRGRVRIYPPEELTAAAPDGYPVHGWVVRPNGDGPHPVLLLIHGGPFAQYGWRLFDEAQVYAGAGYAVVLGNPRGSSGYGEAHGRAVIGDVGPVSAIDLMALLDAALRLPDLDQSRVGVLGGSHGGYMTTWLAAHHGARFRAAVSERAVNAIDSFTGSSDIGWYFADALYGADPAAAARQSPLTYADLIDVPLLIIHSEHDWRCPIEQAQRLFVALKRRDAEVEMLIFPGEGHELSRSGRPLHRVARFEAIIDWFSRWMRV
ncbi:MAG: S9 family peptidase [Micromonosporaceae bacterium]